MKQRGSSLFEALIVVLVICAIAGAGFYAGRHVADSAWQAKEATRLQEERNAADAERLRAEKASGAFQAELLAQRIANDQLQGGFDDFKRKHRPLIARRAAAAGANACATSNAGGNAASADADAVSGDGDVALSLGAVWMWNSALFQRDTPAGACGSADISEGACAPEAGVSLEQAWDNHALNARLCAEDRLRHQRLIDFINGRKQ